MKPSLLIALLLSVLVVNGQTKQEYYYYLIGYNTPKYNGNCTAYFKYPPTHEEVKKTMADNKIDTTKLAVMSLSPLTKFQYENFFKPLSKIKR